MKYATVALTQDPEVRHPMHQFVVETEGYEGTRLLASTFSDGVLTALFQVDGWPPGPYEGALAAVDAIEEYAVSPQADGTFAVYVRDRLADHDRELIGAFGRVGLVVCYPVVYPADGTVLFTVVGPSETLQTALAETPAGMSVSVERIGDYDRRRIGGDRALTDRQAEAVAAAVDCGYYENPRDGSVADVAERLDCTPSTAAEHLRRAERTVMPTAVDTTLG